MTEPAKTAHIRWDEVYQFRDDFPEKHRQTYIDKLKAKENTPDGQKLFAELKAKQSLVPADYQWPNVNITQDANGHNILTIDSTHASRDPRKLLIMGTVGPTKNERGEIQKISHQPSSHSLLIIFPDILNSSTIVTEPDSGRKVLKPFDFGDFIAHESGHSIENLARIFDKGPNYSTSCKEEHALVYENASRRSQDPKAPYRLKYQEADANMAHFMQSIPLMDKAMFQLRRAVTEDKTAKLTKDMNLEKLVHTAGKLIQYDSGCTEMSNEQIIAQTRQLLKKYDIETQDLSASTMAIWLDLRTTRDGKSENLTTPPRR